jgi:hypothetical protein
LTIVARNDAPTAVNDGGTAYTTPQGSPLTVPAAGVLSNDTDVDSILTRLRVSGAPLTLNTSAGNSVTINADGSFTYTPTIKGFFGPDSFTYKANDGTWPSETSPTGQLPMSPDSAPATVTITVTKSKK